MDISGQNDGALSFATYVWTLKEYLANSYRRQYLARSDDSSNAMIINNIGTVQKCHADSVSIEVCANTLLTK